MVLPTVNPTASQFILAVSQREANFLKMSQHDAVRARSKSLVIEFSVKTKISCR